VTDISGPVRYINLETVNTDKLKQKKVFDNLFYGKILDDSARQFWAGEENGAELQLMWLWRVLDNDNRRESMVAAMVLMLLGSDSGGDLV